MSLKLILRLCSGSVSKAAVIAHIEEAAPKPWLLSNSFVAKEAANQNTDWLCSFYERLWTHGASLGVDNSKLEEERERVAVFEALPLVVSSLHSRLQVVEKKKSGDVAGTESGSDGPRTDTPEPSGLYMAQLCLLHALQEGMLSQISNSCSMIPQVKALGVGVN